MKEVKKFYESEVRNLTMEVDSNLTDLNLASVDPLWKLIEVSNLKGDFRLYINKKIQGAHEHDAVVKVVGLNRTLTQVVVKFQCSPEYSYEGTLFGRANGDSTVGVSYINQTLREIAGNSWHDPYKPVKKIQEVVFTPQPLVSVDRAITTAITPPESVQPAQLVPEEKGARGISRNFELTKQIFVEILGKAVSKEVNSVAISDIIIASVYGSESGKDRRGCGAIMSAWVRKDWLKREGRKGVITIYTITDSAMRTFGLESASNSTTTVTAVEMLKTPVPVMVSVEQLSDSNLLGALRVIREKADKFNVARITIDELELRKMQIEDDLKKVQGEIDALKLILDDADLQKATTIWSGLQDSVSKTT